MSQFKMFPHNSKKKDRRRANRGIGSLTPFKHSAHGRIKIDFIDWVFMDNILLNLWAVPNTFFLARSAYGNFNILFSYLRFSGIDNGRRV